MLIKQEIVNLAKLKQEQPVFNIFLNLKRHRFRLYISNMFHNIG